MDAVLYVDDEEEELQAFELAFGGVFRVLTCREGDRAASLVQKERPRAVVVDLKMPRYDGFRVLADLRALPASPPVMVLSGFKEPFQVVRALREGAVDFVSKPYHAAMLRRRISAAILASSRRGAVKEAGESALVGSSAPMRAVRERIASLAASDFPVLVTGETGSGKDLAARALHAASRRASGPWIVRNLGALPGAMAESELLGVTSGAYTDARDRPGCFELAHGGTLFLDELAEAAAPAQAALLRVVDDGVVRRLGGTTERKIDCRIVCATNRDLAALCARGLFRDDLRYRLEVLTLRMPPLRERPEDVGELVADCLGRCGAEHRLPDFEDALPVLSARDWPGNVRQLFSAVQRALIAFPEGAVDPVACTRI